MQNRRTHYFPANDCKVVTGLLPNGEYGATRLDEDEGRIRGFGHSRLAAIADLAEAIEAVGSIYDLEPFPIVESGAYS